MKDFTNEAARQLGARIVAMLESETEADGRVSTVWGGKTLTGLGHTMKDFTDEAARQLGSQTVAMLELKLGADGRIDTTWGSKTLTGLGRTIVRIVEEVSREIEETTGDVGGDPSGERSAL